MLLSRRLSQALFAIALSSVFSASAGAAVLDRVEATVNGQNILLSDIRKFRETLALRSQLDPLFSGTALASKGNQASDADIVDFLVNERMISQQFPVTDAEVEQEINSIQSTNKIDRTQLKSALKEQGFSFDDYFDLIRAGSAKRTLIDRDIRTRVSISDDDVKNYFVNHYAKSSGTPLSYHVLIITVSSKTYKTSTAAKDAAQKALNDIRGGESFEEVAKRVSDDASAQSGGDLGYLTDDQMSGPIREQLKKMKIGEVSPVLGSPSSGLFLLKLIDIRSGESEKFAKLKEEIRGQLGAAEYQHQISLWIERQRQRSFIHKAGESSLQGINAGP